MTTPKTNKDNRDNLKHWTTMESLKKNSEKQPIILVVDDDDKILKLLQVNLSIDGYQVVGVSNGSSALESLGDIKPDLVILDVMMPGLDGFQVLDLIRQQSDVPVIIVTASWDMITNQEAAGLKADNYLKKPFNISELTDRVKTKLQPEIQQGLK
jgi:two-component system, OmpR family, response regulator RpaB